MQFLTCISKRERQHTQWACVDHSRVEGGGSEQCLRNHLRGGKPGSSDDTNELSEPR